MPCRDEYAEEADRRENVDKVHRLTRYLCTLMQQLEDAKVINDYGSLEIQEWWRDHKEADKRRAQREKARKAEDKKRLKEEIAQRQRELKKLERDDG